MDSDLPDLKENQPDSGMLNQSENSGTDSDQIDIVTGLHQNLMAMMGNQTDWTGNHLVVTGTVNQSGTGWIQSQTDSDWTACID